MANHNPQPKNAKHGKELVQRTRAGILNAFDAVEKRGQLISEALADAFLADPLRFMDTAAKYIPKGTNIEAVNVTNALQLTDDQLLQIIESRQKQAEKVIEPVTVEQVVKEYAEEHY